MTVSAQAVIMAFEPEGIEVPMSAILPVKQLPASIKTTRKYVQIAASIAEVGIIELDLSRFRAAPSARLSHLPFESDGTFPSQR